MTSKQMSQNEILVQAIAEAAIQTMATTGMARQKNAGFKMRNPILKQPTFNSRTQHKYEELQNFKLEVSNMLQNYNVGPAEKISVIKNWLDRGGPQLIAHLKRKNKTCAMTNRAYLILLIKKQAKT